MTEQEQGVQRRRPRGRSPSFPGISLPAAIERAKVVHQREGRHSAPIAAIMAHWGYKSPSGPATVTFAALKKYGLLDDEGSGDTRVARLTDLAIEILMKPDPKEAIKRAALHPPIHREMWDEYGAALPSLDTLKYKLVAQRGFTEGGFKEFIREYQETVAFAKLDENESSVDAADRAWRDQLEDSSDGGPEQRLESEHRRREPPQDRRPKRSGEVLSIPVPLQGTSPVVIEGEFPISEAAWQQLLAVLHAMKPGLVIAPEPRELGEGQGQS